MAEQVHDVPGAKSTNAPAFSAAGAGVKAEIRLLTATGTASVRRRLGGSIDVVARTAGAALGAARGAGVVRRGDAERRLHLPTPWAAAAGTLEYAV